MFDYTEFPWHDAEEKADLMQRLPDGHPNRTYFTLPYAIPTLLRVHFIEDPDFSDMLFPHRYGLTEDDVKYKIEDTTLEVTFDPMLVDFYVVYGLGNCEN